MVPGERGKHINTSPPETSVSTRGVEVYILFDQPSCGRYIPSLYRFHITFWLSSKCNNWRTIYIILSFQLRVKRMQKEKTLNVLVISKAQPGVKEIPVEYSFKNSQNTKTSDKSAVVCATHFCNFCNICIRAGGSGEERGLKRSTLQKGDIDKQRLLNSHSSVTWKGYVTLVGGFRGAKEGVCANFVIAMHVHLSFLG